MKHVYMHLHVFADEAFSGNQLAVFTDAKSLDGDRMQKIAREMAFPETTFVFPPESLELARFGDRFWSHRIEIDHTVHMGPALECRSLRNHR